MAMTQGTLGAGYGGKAPCKPGRVAAPKPKVTKPPKTDGKMPIPKGPKGPAK